MVARHLIVVLALALAAPTARAQLAAAIGKPLPSPDLPVGTVSVRVIDGSPEAPLANVSVWLSVDGIAKTMTTDAAGRAVFAGLAVGATVIAALDPATKSESFVVAGDAGTRVLLSARPLGPTPAVPMPHARDISGTVRPDEGTPVGVLDVRLTYDDLADPKPPAKVAVALVGYRSDGTVTVVTAQTDGTGVARFAGLDHTGAVAYYALATLPRDGRADRLASAPVVLDDMLGARVVLSAEARTTKAPPVDDLDPRKAIAKDSLAIWIDGRGAPGSPLHVIDAATGKTIASAVGEASATIALPHPPAILYIEAIIRGERYRSRPFQPVSDRGAELLISAYPNVAVRLGMLAEPVGAAMTTWMEVAIENTSWIPYSAPLSIPLPVGLAAVELAPEDRARGAVTATGVVLGRPLAPGKQRVHLRFELAAGGDGKVKWDQELLGASIFTFRILDEPGLSITGMPVTSIPIDGVAYLEVSRIPRQPHEHLTMAIALPKVDAKQAAVAKACQPLDPDRKTALRGKAMPDFTAPQLDGKPLHLAALKGKVIVVNFMATWDMLSAKERPTFAPLVDALGKDLAIVLVASDDDRAEVRAKVGASPAFRIVLDPTTTHDPEDRVGAITKSWGVHLLPESFVIDRHGIVRLYLSNWRDWSTPEARACLAAIAKD